MADSKPTHVVTRSGFYRRYNGKLQSLTPGTPLTLSAVQGERLIKRGFVKALEQEKAKPAPEPVLEKEEPETDEPEKKPKKKAKKKKSKA